MAKHLARDRETETESMPCWCYRVLGLLFFVFVTGYYKTKQPGHF